MGKHVSVQMVEKRVALVSLSNPPYNLCIRPLVEEMVAVIQSLERDSAVGAVILTSALDNIFISHYDVSEILEMGAALKMQLPQPVIRGALVFEEWLAYIPGVRNALKSTLLGGLGALNLYHAMARGIRQSSKVWIAQINGRALGGGCELALACDYRLMIDGRLEDGVSAIGQPEAILSLIPGGGGTQMLSRIVGHARALEICLGCEPLTASQALQAGLVTKTCKSQQALREETHKFARRMANRSPASIKAIKLAVHEGGSLPLSQGLLLEAGGFAATAGLPKAQVAMAEYIEKMDEVLGDQLNIDSLQPWLAGTKLKIV